MAKLSQLEKAIAALEADKAVLELAIAKLLTRSLDDFCRFSRRALNVHENRPGSLTAQTSAHQR